MAYHYKIQGGIFVTVEFHINYCISHNLKIGALVQENRRPIFIRKNCIKRLYFKSEEVDIQ